MSTLRIGLRENRTHFAPGDKILGVVDWSLESAPKKAEIRLGWSTVGKGTTDSATVDRVKLKGLEAAELRNFELEAPAEPYSFSGQLVSLVWAVEVVLQPSGDSARCEIVIAPEGKEVLLPGVSEE
jgi:hypothetical protein